ncbi:Oligoendopeptidase F [Fructilactobacillus florum 8D]|uniref:Oligopeptidase F n=1 Tax=Fructilactobacillus florum 8D TaxID=1221538 RepID=W9ED13_9LACO|nr:Oligoendopeptidase F [Fructilactobacillus florum 2F]ETO39952.1 Oligoendopeptidase F [Fructilactobacillus florum 8D]
MTAKALPKRSEVDPQLTWDLTTIFANQADFQAELVAVKTLAQQLKKTAVTKFISANTLQAATEQVLQLNRRFEKVRVFAELQNDVETTVPSTQAALVQTEQLDNLVSEAQAWYPNAVVATGATLITTWLKSYPSLQTYHRFLELNLRAAGHLLPVNQEQLLAQATQIFNAPEKIFNQLDSSDLPFPTVTDEQGNRVQLSNGRYGLLLESTQQAVRAETFHKTYEVYQQFQNTFATTLGSQVNANNFSARVHHFESAQAQALFENEVPQSVFDTLITEVHRHLPLLQRYVALRKRFLHTEQLHMYDMYVPLATSPQTKYTFAEAKQLARQALQVLGPTYQQLMETAFKQRWIDVVENENKRTGAYSSGSYDTNPFILLNWQDNLNNVYTLVHEMGHSIHSAMTRKHQPYQTGDYSIFVAEIASTTNENLLTDYLLEHTTDDNLKKYILSLYLEGFKGTIFRQTQFAEFEKLIHHEAQRGTPLTASQLNQWYLQLNSQYYGPDLQADPEIQLEWARIPHFYYDFYVYQYATGYAAAINLAENLETGGQTARRQYFNYLQAGNSKAPLDIMKMAGVAMDQSAYLTKSFTQFEKRLAALEKLI